MGELGTEQDIEKERENRTKENKNLSEAKKQSSLRERIKER